MNTAGNWAGTSAAYTPEWVEAEGYEAELAGQEGPWLISQFCTLSLVCSPELWVHAANWSLAFTTCTSHRHNRSDLSKTEDLSLKVTLFPYLLSSLIAPPVASC